MGRLTCLDFTATNAPQAATIEGCAKDRAYAVDRAVATKLRHYMDRCEAEGPAYIPWPSTPLAGGTSWRSRPLGASPSS